MIPAIQDWVYQHYSSLRADEVIPKLEKVIFCAPALVALGTQAFGSLPLQPVIVTIAVADAIFHYIAVRNPEICQKAKKYEWVFYGVRLAVLTWTVGHLFQTLSNYLASFPLTGASILKTYSTHHPGRMISINHGPYRPAPYVTLSVDGWFWSWPVTIAGMIGVNKLVGYIHRWIAKEKVNLKDAIPKGVKDVTVKIQYSEQYLPKPPLWVAVLQQVTYVSLAVFSKSHLVFIGLSGLSLCTFYESVLYTRASLRQMIMTVQFVKQSDHFKYKHFEYTEQFAVRENVQKEVACELERLCNEAATFKPFNFQQSDKDKPYTIHCLKMPFSIPPSLTGQISGNQLHMRKEGLGWRPIELVHLPYQQGMKIQVQIDKWDMDCAFLNITLDNGTFVQFPGIFTRKILKMGIKTIEATVDKIEVKNEQLYLRCSSTELPNTERLAFTWNKEIRKIPFTLNATVDICEKGQKQASCSQCKSISNLFYYESCEPYSAVCKSCITADFENRVKNFTIVNATIVDVPIRYDPFFSSFDKAKFKVWAQKEQLPDGSTLRLTATRSCVEIGWLDYPVGKKVKVQLQHVIGEIASGKLPDGTTVELMDADRETASEMIHAQKTIDAQICYKNVVHDQLVLFCISRALPPKLLRLTSTSYMQLRNGSLLQMDCMVYCKPTLSDQDEVCNICSNTSEILFYECADKTHTACIPCLSENFKVQFFNNLKILNFRNIQVRNQEGQIVRSYSLPCFDKESLPNCLYCRSPVVDKSQLAVLVQNVKAEVLILNYKIDDIVQFHIEEFFEDGMPYGELDDGTLVMVKDLQQIQAHLFKALRTPINAKILNKTIQNGQLCLTCTFISTEPL
jgi:hypothetical protein